MERPTEYSIGEFSKLTGTSIKTLRYYDEIDLLKPIYKDTTNNFRYYSKMQYVYLDFIKRLKNLNFSLKEIKSFLHDKPLDEIEEYFLGKEKEINCSISKLKKDKKIVDNFLEYISKVKTGELTDFKISLKHIDVRNIIYVHEENFTKKNNESYFKVYEKLYSLEKNIETYGCYFERFYAELDKIDPKCFSFDFCREVKDKRPVDPSHFDVVPAGEYVCTRFKGDKSTSFENYLELKKWMKTNDYIAASYPIMVFIYPIFIRSMSESFHEPIKEIQIRVEKSPK